MSKVRTGIWILVFILLMLLFFQNQSIFLAQRSLRLNLYFANYQTPELYEGLFFLASLVIGYLIAYLFSLGERFKARRTIRQLASANDSQRQEIASLRNQVQDLMKLSAPGASSEMPVDPAASERIRYPEPPPGEPNAVATTEAILPVEPEKPEDTRKKNRS
jgi:uncharacterized integral membrane protein